MRQLAREGEFAQLARHVLAQASFRAQRLGLGGGSKWTPKHTAVLCGLSLWYPLILHLVLVP